MKVGQSRTAVRLLEHRQIWYREWQRLNQLETKLSRELQLSNDDRDIPEQILSLRRSIFTPEHFAARQIISIMEQLERSLLNLEQMAVDLIENLISGQTSFFVASRSSFHEMSGAFMRRLEDAGINVQQPSGQAILDAFYALVDECNRIFSERVQTVDIVTTAMSAFAPPKLLDQLDKIYDEYRGEPLTMYCERVRLELPRFPLSEAKKYHQLHSRKEIATHHKLSTYRDIDARLKKFTHEAIRKFEVFYWCRSIMVP